MEDYTTLPAIIIREMAASREPLNEVQEMILYDLLTSFQQNIQDYGFNVMIELINRDGETLQ